MIRRLLVLVALAACVHGAAVGEEGDDRESKLLPVIKIVTFPNDPCTAASGEMGICYSQKECNDVGGRSSGTCASGFGVCCVQYATCDGTITQNGTYFTNPGYDSSYSTAGMCMVTIVPPAGTCQIRLDFEEFELLGPVDGDCGNDTFMVTGNDIPPTVPTLCGHNTGQHLYFSASASGGPYKLLTTLSGLGGARKWKIKVTFIECGHPCPAPGKCLQFFKAASGTINSFNYLPGKTGNQMLNNLAYSACFADLPGLCDISMVFNELSHGNSVGPCGLDYLGLIGVKLCGDTTSFITQSNATGPHVLTVVSDDSNDFGDKGFSVDYMMLPC